MQPSFNWIILYELEWTSSSTSPRRASSKKPPQPDASLIPPGIVAYTLTGHPYSVSFMEEMHTKSSLPSSLISVESRFWTFLAFSAGLPMVSLTRSLSSLLKESWRLSDEVSTLHLPVHIYNNRMRSYGRLDNDLYSRSSSLVINIYSAF